MDKPWLMDEAKIDKIEYRMRRRSDRREVTLAVCRAQHLKTLEWLEKWMEFCPYAGKIARAPRKEILWIDLETILAQARKDVEE